MSDPPQEFQWLNMLNGSSNVNTHGDYSSNSIIDFEQGFIQFRRIY